MGEAITTAGFILLVIVGASYFGAGFAEVFLAHALMKRGVLPRMEQGRDLEQALGIRFRTQRLQGFDRRLAIITSYLPVTQRYLLLIWCITTCGLVLYWQFA
jgi:hypothetical protein